MTTALKDTFGNRTNVSIITLDDTSVDIIFFVM